MILEKELQELFYDLHESGLFPDGKIISDAALRVSPTEVLAAYRSRKSAADFDLQSFFDEFFVVATAGESGYVTEEGISIGEHIDKLWSVLTRTADDELGFSSRIPLPHPYIVPGGRFDEIYYWDSYFTMLGLRVAGRTDMITHMVDNFAWMLDTYGLIPNGNRTYYLGRSQPPFFACMVQLLADIEGDQVYERYLTALQQEYDFWMTGADKASPQGSYRRVVNYQGNTVNRYYDNIEQPRTEMYTDDVELIAKGGQQLVTHIRAACESGWDFSSRWLADQQSLDSIHTTDIIPVDLNSLLYNLEEVLHKTYQMIGDDENAQLLSGKAAARRSFVREQMYSTMGYFADVDITSGRHTGVLSAATVFPLFFHMATEEQAAAVSKAINQHLLRDGGLVTTTLQTGQQWDSPNGWAPLQWMAYQGLCNYGHHELAHTIRDRWLSLCEKVFDNTGKLMEKYNVVDTSLLSGGGEYPVQDGFGWTNGVYLALQAAKSREV